MSPNILEIKVNSLVERNRIEEAKILLEEARRYHKFSGDDDIKFIRILEEKISGKDNIEELRRCYGRVIDSQPENLIRIFPEKLNGKLDIYEFLVKEMVLAANKMLDKINSVSIIKNEDKYNDLVQLALESRISTWGWTVKDQTRKAFSPSSKKGEENLGEIDLDIQDFNKTSFITCEAFILRDIPRVQSHIEKIIAHYTSRRSAFIILVYFKGKNKNFESKWDEYSGKIIPNLNFPESYKIISKKVKDISNAFNCSKTAIKVGCSEHESDSKLYHVFVNLNYQIK